MRKYLQNIIKDTLVVIALLQVAIVLILTFGKDEKSPVAGTNTVTTHTVYFDSTQKNIPVLSIPGTVSFYPVFQPMDTAMIGLAIRNYFASFTYSQTIQDSSLRATIFDSISQNRVMARRFNYAWLKPIKTVESTTVTPPAPQKFGFYAGGFVDYNKNALGIGPKISFETKKNLVFS